MTDVPAEFVIWPRFVAQVVPSSIVRSDLKIQQNAISRSLRPTASRRQFIAPK